MNARLTDALLPYSVALLVTFSVVPLPIVNVLAAALFVADLKLPTVVVTPVLSVSARQDHSCSCRCWVFPPIRGLNSPH